MPSQHNSGSDASHLFQDAMRDVKPLKNNHKSKNVTQPTRRGQLPAATYQTRRLAAEQEDRPTSAALSDTWVEPTEAEQVLYYAQSGVSKSQVKKLQQGLFSIQYILDLHGYTIDEARDTIIEFLRFCQKKGFRCAHIVHGKAHKGLDRQATLKSHVNHWLKQLPMVLAFCSSPRSMGGTGSVLVLIKKQA